MAILASLSSYAVGVLLGCLIGFLAIKRLTAVDLAEARDEGYRRAIAETRARNTERAKKAAATRRRST